MVVDRMTLREKVGELALRSSGLYENVNAGVARLCIPSLTLQDGPAGLAFGDTGVTQLPAPLGLAASFDPNLARQYGQLIADEAAGQGIDVVQGPNLNIDRVPESGQGFTGYGEDPLLVAAMGDATIAGIQSRGVMADAKHFAVYSQETNRGSLDAEPSNRALQEIYLAPFQSAVTRANVASLMCAYPRLNLTFQCQDPALARVLQQWGFAGFVRSDQGAVHDPVAALKAGTDLLKPASVSRLAAAVARGAVPLSTIDANVRNLLTHMFSFGLIGRGLAGIPGTPVNTANHAAVALQDAERSMVLLRNQGHTLPLHAARLRSVAVVGAAALNNPVTAGSGSSHVVAPFVSTPLAAITARFGHRVAVRYADGGSTTRPLPPIPTTDLTPMSGRGHGVTLSVGRVTGPPSALTVTDPTAAASVRTEAPTRRSPTSVEANPLALHRPGSPGRAAARPNIVAAGHAAQITLPPRWGAATVTWRAMLRVPRTGLYSLSLTGSGSVRLLIDGSVAVDDNVTHGPGTWSAAINLQAGHSYSFRLNWLPLDNQDGVKSSMAVGLAYESDALRTAVAAARQARAAIVFATDNSGETFDRPSLRLPGDQDALIAAVAAASPHTIVVLQTSGPVVMPWLRKVAAVVEAWYPGEEGGAASAALLAGDFDPSGHLPVTFPASAATSAVSRPAQWPGTDLVSSYPEGLDVGYRYNQATGTPALFPFGFGLSFTTFSFRNLVISPGPGAVHVSVELVNTGRRAGTDAVQAYLTYPPAAGEPPGQLVAFRSIGVRPGAAAKVNLTIDRDRFRTYRSQGWTIVPGHYTLAVGDSSTRQPVLGSFSYR
jgi:beta-glucosidase